MNKRMLMHETWKGGQSTVPSVAIVYRENDREPDTSKSTTENAGLDGGKV